MTQRKQTRERAKEKRHTHTHTYIFTHAHARSPSCLCIADTNKGCWGFDSARQAATAQQGWPFTACQPAPLQEASTKSHRMWDSLKRDDSDTVTSNLKHAGIHKKADGPLQHHRPPHRHTQAYTHTHILVIRSHPVLLPLCSGTAAGLSDCQSHWWICSAMSKSYPPTFLTPFSAFFLKITTLFPKTQSERKWFASHITSYLYLKIAQHTTT